MSSQDSDDEIQFTSNEQENAKHGCTTDYVDTILMSSSQKLSQESISSSQESQESAYQSSQDSSINDGDDNKENLSDIFSSQG